MGAGIKNDRGTGRALPGRTFAGWILWTAGACALVLLPLLPVLLRSGWVLRFNDNSLAFALSPFARLPGAWIRYWDPQSFFGIGNRQAASGLFTAVDAIMGPVAFRRWGPAVLLVPVAGAVYWMLRTFGWRRRACAFAAGTLMLSGAAFTYAVCGLGIRPLALGFNALAVGFIERGRRNRAWLPYLAAGGFVGSGIAEVPDVGAFLALATAFVLVVTHAAERPLRAALGRAALALALVSGAAVPAAWQMLGIMADTQIRDVSPATAMDAGARYDWATQWSIPPAESWAIVAGSYFGTTTDGATPYWGRMGRTPGWEETGAGYRNFSLTGWHLGAIPAALLLALIPMTMRPGSRRRRDRGKAALVLAGLAGTLVLAWGRYTPLYRAVLALPFLHTIRNPEKWMIPFALFAAMGIAMSLDRLLEGLERGGDSERRAVRSVAGALLVLLGVALAVWTGTVAGRDRFVQARARDGFTTSAAPAPGLERLPGEAESLHAYAVGVSFHTVFFLAAACALVGIPGLRRRGVLLFSGLSFLTGVHLVPLAAGYVQTQPVRPTAGPNALTHTLDAGRADGRIKLLATESHGMLLNQFRLTFLMARGYELFDPISVSRMPRDYATLFEALAESPFRLWELGSIRFLLAEPGAAESLDVADGGRGRFRTRESFSLALLDGQLVPVAVDDGPRLLDLVVFEGALPLLHPVHRLHAVSPNAAGDEDALRRLAAPGFRPEREAVVYGGAGLPETFARPDGPVVRALHIKPAFWEAELAPSDEALFLVRSVRFDPDWTAAADGVPIPLQRVNYLFQGVRIPPGTRRLTFAYRPSRMPLAVSVAARLLAAALGAVWLLRSRVTADAGALS